MIELRKKGVLHHKLFRICEPVCAQRLLNAAWLFKDAVFDRLALINDIRDVFAADISRHANCLSGYLLKYDRMMSKIMENQDKEIEGL